MAHEVYEDVHQIHCVMGCEAMLRAMLASGQHYWTLATAKQFAEQIGMTAPVRKGIA